jgi:hypothetical protein
MFGMFVVFGNPFAGLVMDTAHVIAEEERKV